MSPLLVLVNPFHDIGLIGTIALVLVTVAGVLARTLKERSGQSWPVVQGTVESADMVRERDSLRAEVRYSYSVDGNYYSGLFFRIPTSEKRGEKLLALFPKYSHVLVHYKPGSPEISLLDRNEIKARSEFSSIPTT